MKGGDAIGFYFDSCIIAPYEQSDSNLKEDGLYEND